LLTVGCGAGASKGDSGLRDDVVCIGDVDILTQTGRSSRVDYYDDRSRWVGFVVPDEGQGKLEGWSRWDERDRLLERVVLQDGSMVLETVATYGAHGETFRRDVQVFGGESWWVENVTTYDAQGRRLLRTTRSNAEGFEETDVEYTYDESGWSSSSAYDAYDGDLQSTTRSLQVTGGRGHEIWTMTQTPADGLRLWSWAQQDAEGHTVRLVEDDLLFGPSEFHAGYGQHGLVWRDTVSNYGERVERRSWTERGLPAHALDVHTPNDPELEVESTETTWTWRCID